LGFYSESKLKDDLAMPDKGPELSRRQAALLLAEAGAACLLLPSMVAAQKTESLASRAIPATGEKLPLIGLGTHPMFDVGDSPNEQGPLREVVRRFAELGGRVIDTSPMYGRAESVVGRLTSELHVRDSLFLATKVWSTGKQMGIEQMEQSFTRLGTQRIDLMQVHNLIDAETQLATMRAWKEQGRIRYLGVTHYLATLFPEVEKILRREQLDFLQINYSMIDRVADERVLPLARDRGVAVLINRPFATGELFRKLQDKPLPAWGTEFDCKSWGQFLLKWIVAHPAVTCVIPATGNVRHLEDNMAAGFGRLPDEKMRERMVQFIQAA
jgi:diketogulonate reductase-like aldo/keto reductase